MSSVRLAVISDLHASESHDEDTYVHSEPPDAQVGQHPVADLFRFVGEEGIRADYLLCPGDLADKSDDGGKIYAWDRLQSLARLLGASDVLATPGNHDLTTYEPVPDPAMVLKNLHPSYPTRQADRDMSFWEEGFVIIERDSHRFLILNSCADFPPHPGTGASKRRKRAYYQRLERGGFPDSLQRRLEGRLQTLTECPVNIALCHHHPREHEQLDLFKDSYGPMRRGDDLLRVLEHHHRAGRWLVIHGHKHVPQLIGSSGTSTNSPILLCSASAGGRLWHPVVTATKNQFHVVSVETEPEPGLPRLRGQVESYMWGFGSGWATASRRMSGLPARCGFGVSHDHRDHADAMRAILETEALTFIAWPTVIEALPSLLYQGPRDYDLLEEYLHDLGLCLIRDPRGNIRQLAREG